MTTIKEETKAILLELLNLAHEDDNVPAVEYLIKELYKLEEIL